ncbi:hypothetical protein GOTRE_044_01110 [Gordonia terrae NBRC 100016]|uniref:DUF222 domain-containing protein n=1 Tax=Gordonia terrae NBRC 100016 TaxID=1089454 RepID=A0ABQ0HCI6_9ACTN|nr:hypothetical protein GOTRE_044_01110 [Gordonia terrae NBRC 100016]
MAVWTDLPGEFVAGVDPARAGETDMVLLMAGLDATRRGESYLAWHRYQTIAVMADRLVTTTADGFVMDGHADCAARIARQGGVSRRQAEVLIDEAIALRDRLPDTAETLRDGIVSQWQIRLILSRTELIPADDPITPVLDAEIAATLRRRTGCGTGPACGTWSIGWCFVMIRMRCVNAAKMPWTSVGCGPMNCLTGPPN